MMLKKRFDQRLSGRRLQRGQGMTEYIIIVALVAIAAIGVYSFFGQAVRGQMASITGQLAGNAGAGGITDAKDVAVTANAQAAKQNNLGTYAANTGSGSVQ